MTDLRDGSRCRNGADGSLGSRRVARKVLLLGGYVVAGWVGLCAFGGHHAAEAATVPTVSGSSAHAGLLDAVTASALSGPQAADAAPSKAALALPHLSDLTPVRAVLGADQASAPAGKPAPNGAGPSSSIVGNVADLPDAAHIGKQVEETLTAVTAPVRTIHSDVIAPVTKTTVPSGSDPIRTITDGVSGVVDGVTGSLPDGGNVAAPAPATPSAPATTTTATAAPKSRAAQHPAEVTTRPASSGRVTAAPVPALDPATSSAHHFVRIAPSAAGAHSPNATQTPRGSLRSGAGAPTAPPQNPGPLPVLPGNVAAAGATGTTSQLGSGFSGSALLADQMMMAAHLRAAHTVQHDNARIARAEAAAPSCSPD